MTSRRLVLFGFDLYISEQRNVFPRCPRQVNKITLRALSYNIQDGGPINTPTVSRHAEYLCPRNKVSFVTGRVWECQRRSKLI